MKKWVKAAAVMVLGAALFMPAMMSEARMPSRIGIPNPLVEYDSYGRLGQVVGFQPLFLTKSFGYKVDSYIAISRQTADIRYSNDDGARLTVRSALRDRKNGGEDISGVYTGKWEKKEIAHSTVYVAKTDEKTYTARWTCGAYAFAVTGEGMSEEEFSHILAGYFVDMTEHYYSDRVMPVAGGAAF
ncbi:hypothetical protein [uncultured Dialister sp.]|uniref:hypothetical protein n=1 Tax=uncultured Dialister sp. TaxID=278064 RepID=UPI00260A65E6|nr:hypothetical protein [uncultured Dialister sp.]